MTSGRSLSYRLATLEDQDALSNLMEVAITELQKPFLSAEQIAASRTFMGLDTELITDRTYFVVEVDGELAGCGGWGRRATLYGGNRTPGRNATLLDPRVDCARPGHVQASEPCAEGRCAADPPPVRARCGSARFPSHRADGDVGGHTHVPRLRLHGCRAHRGFARRRSGSARQHAQVARADSHCCCTVGRALEAGAPVRRGVCESLTVDLSFQNFRHELEHLSDAYSSPTGAFFLAELNEESVGCIGLRRFAERVGEIKRLYVSPSDRGHGIGRLLVEATIAAARDLGFARVVLDTLPSMQSARKLYAELGFTPTAPYRFNPIGGTAYLEKAVL
jgi:GNAT superfamily N-acetyltransferase